MQQHEIDRSNTEYPPEGEIAIYSPDVYSQERIQALQKSTIAIRERMPYVAGCLLFGSLSKGKDLDEGTAHMSDVDTLLVFDADALNRALPTLRSDAGITMYARSLAIQQGRQEPTDEDIRQSVCVTAVGEFRNIWSGQFSKSSAPQLEIGAQQLSTDSRSPYALTNILRGKDIGVERTGMLFGCDIDGGLRMYRNEYASYLAEGLFFGGMAAEDMEDEWSKVRGALEQWLPGSEQKQNTPSENVESLLAAIPQTARDAATRYSISTP